MLPDAAGDGGLRPEGRRLLAIIPAWNEEATLASVVAEIRAHAPDADVLVVDDGSTDRTADVARSAGVALLEMPYNLGVGGAMRAGYKYAQRRGYELTVQVDADGQHDPAHIESLVAALDSEGADIMIGARFVTEGGYAVSGPRRWAMRALAAVLSRTCGTRLTDTTSGFKVCSSRAIALFSVEYPAEYLGDTVESLVIASRAGLRIRQAEVRMRPRAGGAPSHGPIRSTVFLGRAVLALVVALTRPQRPGLQGGTR